MQEKGLLMFGRLSFFAFFSPFLLSSNPTRTLQPRKVLLIKVKRLIFEVKLNFTLFRIKK